MNTTLHLLTSRPITLDLIPLATARGSPAGIAPKHAGPTVHSQGHRMGFPDDITRVSDILLTLLQSSLRVIVVTERMRHASVALHSHRVACRLEELAVLMRLIPAEIVFCRDDVCSRHAFKGLCKYRRRPPVIQRSSAEFCVLPLAKVFTGTCSRSLLTRVFRYPVVHEPVHTRSGAPRIMLHHRYTRILLRYF